MLVVLLHLIIVSFGHTGRITREQNAELKKRCGESFLGGRRSKMSYGAQIADNQYPWLATLEISRLHSCMGVLISPRHVLTAAHCLILRQDPKDSCPHGVRNARIHKNNDDVFPRTVTFGPACSYFEECDRRRAVKTYYFHEDFGECTMSSNLGIVELEHDVPTTTATPICMPGEQVEISKHLKTATSGGTSTASNILPFSLVRDDRQVVYLKFLNKIDDKITTSVPRGTGICTDDSGAPIFQSTKNRRNVLIGIVSDGNTCRQGKKDVTDTATDVRDHLSWICEVTGVCPIESNKVSFKISKEENAKIKEQCGNHFLGGSEISGILRSFGGRKVASREYPWLAELEISGTHTCSGVLISPRHVLTAAHCFVLLHAECDYSDSIERYHVAHANKHTVTFGQRCPPGAECENKRRVARYYLHKGFDECSLKDDIAIVELREEVPNSIATPICMPNENEEVATNLKAAGSGLTGPIQNGLPYPMLGDNQEVAVTLVKVAGRKIFTTAPKGVGVCNGDSGGPLFQTDRREKYTVVGILSDGDTCEKNYLLPKMAINNTPSSDYFTDVRAYLTWICEKSGVCPLSDATQQSNNNSSQTRLTPKRPK